MSTVSLIIPTYNRAHLVRRAIKSALSQSRVPDEIIVVDDGSTDNTLELLAAYSAPVIVVADGVNRGRSAARNFGLDAATGDYIAFLDSDDTLPPDSIEKRLNALDVHPNVDVVYTNANFLDENGRLLARFSKIRRRLYPSGDISYELLLDNLAPIHAYMFRVTDDTAHIRLDETLHTLEDYDFWLKLADKSRFLYLDEPLANYHVHQGMTTTNEDDAMRCSRIIVQGRGIHSNRFAQLSPSQRAHILTQHGASYAAIIGDMPQARKFLQQALALKPLNPQAWFYWLVTWSGRRGVDALNQLRRWINRHVAHSAFPTGVTP